jgi:hypothetical protein
MATPSQRTNSFLSVRTIGISGPAVSAGNTVNLVRLAVSHAIRKQKEQAERLAYGMRKETICKIMHKRTLCILLFFLALFLSALAALTAYTLKDEPLTPMAQKALHYQPSPVPPEKNAFVGIAGMDAPTGDDFIALGVANIHANQFSGAPQKEGSAQKLAFSVPQYTYSCMEEITANCLAEIQAEAHNIQKLLAENDEIIKRYLHIQTMPEFSHSFAKTLKYGSAHFVPGYTNLMNASRLLSAKAVLDIQNDRLEEGLDFIEKDLNFYRGILASRDIDLLDTMIAIQQIRRYANLLILLCNEGKLSHRMDKMRALLAPLDAPRNIFANARWFEHAITAQSLFRNLEAELEKSSEVQMIMDFETGEIRKKTFFDQLKLMLFTKPNMTLNLYNEFSRLEIDTLNALATQELPAQRDVLWENEIRPRICTIPEGYLFCRHWKNYLGETLAAIAFPNYVHYLLRIHDLDARLRLFRAQLEFAQAAETAPKTETPEAILARLGPETFNPYTGQPFEWNPETGTIAFMPAGDKIPKPVEIRLLRHRLE